MAEEIESVLNIYRKTPKREPKSKSEPKPPKVQKPKKSKEVDLMTLCEGCAGKRVCVKPDASHVTGLNPVMFIGIQPGPEESTAGEVFVGGSGQYLRNLLAEIGFNNYYLSNVMKCMLSDEEGNIRNPTSEEMKRCGEFIKREIADIQPSYIVLLGEIPLNFFLGRKVISKIRGTIQKKGDYKFIPTFNPAHIVREKQTSMDRQLFEQDLRRVWKWVTGSQSKLKLDGRVFMKACRTYEDIDLCFSEMAKADRFAMDLESHAPGKFKDKSALDPWHPEFRLLCAGFAYPVGKNTNVFTIPLNHPESPLEYEKVLEKLRFYLANTAQKVIGQHIKWDIKVLDVHCGIKVKKIYLDTLLAHVLVTGKKGLSSLERLSIDYLDTDDVGYKEIIRGAKDAEVQIPPLEPLSEMCMKDCVNTLDLAFIFERQLRETELEPYFNRLQAPAIIRLKDMERRGMLVDQDYLRGLNHDLERSLEALHRKMLSYPELGGTEYNLASNDHLNQILFTKFGLPKLIDPKTKKPKETKQGLHPVDQDTLKVLAKKTNCPFLVDFHEWKVQQKLQSTYVTPYLEEYIKSDGRVHGTFNQHITATGRLSGDSPNLQNLPVRSKINYDWIPEPENRPPPILVMADGTPYDASLIMRMFIAPPGWKIVAADYSQIELRVMAAYSGDSSMVEAFIQGKDIHKYMASLIYKVSIDDVTKEQRQRAKSINFGIIYGMTEKGLSEELGIPEKEAIAFIDNYLDTFPGVRGYMDDRRWEYRKFGYVKTLFGRRCYIHKTKDRNGADRRATNYPIQGTAGDINQLALIDLGTVIETEGFVWGPIDVIHDSIIVETPENELEDCILVTKAVMEAVDVSAFMRGIPIKVDMSSGNNLAEAKGKE